MSEMRHPAAVSSGSAEGSALADSVWPVDPICWFVAATNVGSIYPAWSCAVDGSTDSDPCDWTGILCSQNEISSIFVSESALTGTLSPALGSSLTGLRTLELEYNSLTGSLPSSWGSLTGLRTLELDYNSLTGSLPSFWGSLTGLRTLELHYNSLTGSLPSFWGSLTGLNILLLYFNSLTGSLPSSWGSLTGLEELYVHSNHLTGSLPSSWGSLTGLDILELDENTLTGSLPLSWGCLTGLEELFLQSNHLTGSLPSSWGSLTGLDTLALDGGSLTGSLPSSWGCLTAVSTLYLEFNSLTGSLPSSWGCLTGLDQMFLNNNSLTGSLPSSWGSLRSLNVLSLDSNHLTGLLPSSWGSLTGLEELELYANSLTGSLPFSWGSLTGLNAVYLHSNSLSGSLPSSWDSLTKLRYLSLFENCLTGSLALRWGARLQYLYLDDNRFTGSLPSSWGSQLRVLDVGGNMLTGSLPSDQSAYPISLKSLSTDSNFLSGTVPSAVALSGNITYLGVSDTAVVGSIPSEFCSSPGVSINVSGTAIECYSGCLASSPVLVSGASPDCHDGSVRDQFILISGVCASVAVAFTVLYRWFGWWSPWLAQAAGMGGIMGVLFGGIGRLGKIFSFAKSTGPRSGSSVASSTVFGMALAKFLLGVTISLLLDDWWRYSGGADAPGNNAVLASCSNPKVGNCLSFCGDVDIVTVDITDDDVVTQPLDGVSISHKIDHLQVSSYCIASLPGYCGYEYWLDFKLLPVLLQLLGLALQVILWRFGSGEFSETPQKGQYDLILDAMYPHIRGVTGIGEVKAPAITFASRAALLDRLTTPAFPSVFWFLELVTMVYVWVELAFPPLYCGSVLPLSLYYYPILMSLLDLIKLNIYASVQLWEAKRRVESVLVLLDLQLFVTHLWVTVSLGLMFVGFVLRDCFLCLLWCVGAATGRREQVSWPEAKAAADDETVNPMARGADVEMMGAPQESAPEY